MAKFAAGVALACLVAWLGMGTAVRLVKDHASALGFHLDTKLPDTLTTGTWLPVAHHRTTSGTAVAFADGTLSSVRCHQPLGTYTVHVDGGFGFQQSPLPVRPGCPGAAVRRELTHATQVTASKDGRRTTLRFQDDHDHDVLVLRGARR
jgi:hypothetical protein